MGKRPREVPNRSNSRNNNTNKNNNHAHNDRTNNNGKANPNNVSTAPSTSAAALSAAYVSDEDLVTCIDVLQNLRANPDLFRSPRMKLLRTELFPLVQAPVGGHVTRISDALSDGRWEDAYMALEGLRKTGEVPKLGTVQRWVRDCDLAGVEELRALECLDLLLRVACPEQIARAPTPALIAAQHAVDDDVDDDDAVSNGDAVDEEGDKKKEAESEGDRRRQPKSKTNVYRLPAWSGCDLLPGSSVASSLAIRNTTDSSIVGNFSTISRDLAHNRKPPNLHDLPIWVATPNTIKMAPLTERTPVVRTDVPSVKGAFFLQNVLSADECTAFLRAAESVGFTPDVPLTDKTKSVLAHNFCWLADSSFMQPLWERVVPFLNPKIHDCALAGINRRFRCYRYEPGAVYRPHVDGAWPPSGINKETDEYQFDMSDGTLWSKMTFLLYLNEGFEGGWTTFYTPAFEEGKLIASPVSPRVGGVMVFPHGDASGALVHEGSGVTEGVKYIIRTEVIYTKK